MKAIITILLIGIFSNLLGQETSYDAKFNLIVCTKTRNAEAVLLIKDSIENTFSGKFIIDGDERDIYGWYIEKKSEGEVFNYSTEGIVFYVDINSDFKHQQLFKAIYNFDKTFISGDYFYWGNEFIFYGIKEDKQTGLNYSRIDDKINIYPVPVDNILKIDSNQQFTVCKIFDMEGKLILETGYNKELNVSNLNPGTYILTLSNKKKYFERIKFVKI